MKTVIKIAFLSVLVACNAVDPTEHTSDVVSKVSSNTHGWRRGRVLPGANTANATVAVVARGAHEASGNGRRSFSSTSTADVGEVTLTYLTTDSDGPYTETVELNGTTPVATVADDIRYVERVDMASPNIGDVTLWTNDDGTGDELATVGVNTYGNGLGDGHLLAERHYVPAGKESKISAVTANATGSTTWTLRARENANTSNGVTLWTGTGASFDDEIDPPVVVPEGWRVAMFATPGGSNYVLESAFHFKDETAN